MCKLNVDDISTIGNYVVVVVVVVVVIFNAQVLKNYIRLFSSHYNSTIYGVFPWFATMSVWEEHLIRFGVFFFA